MKIRCRWCQHRYKLNGSQYCRIPNTKIPQQKFANLIYCDDFLITPKKKKSLMESKEKKEKVRREKKIQAARSMLSKISKLKPKTIKNKVFCEKCSTKSDMVLKEKIVSIGIVSYYICPNCGENILKRN